MTAFRITVLEEHIRRYSVAELTRAEQIINAGIDGLVVRWREESALAVTYVGEGAPSEVPTLLGAMAQGHPLGPILDHIDARTARP